MMAPVISSVSPNQGTRAGGTAVTLTGSGFTGTSAVRFGTVSAAFTVISATQINATSPPGTGAVSVTVTGPTGTSNGVTYTYLATATLTGVSPTQGPAAGGNTVTLTGSGLSGATAVRFGSTAALSFTIVSDTTVTAVAPAGSGAVSVTVTTSGGTSNGVTYTYLAVPVVSAVSPASGPLSGGTTVVLTGSGFTGASAVTFGGTPAASFTVTSATQISAVAPAGAAGPVNVNVTGPGGTSSPGPVYFYVAGPVVASLSPSQGPAAGGNTVTLSGSGFSGATAVRFGSTAAASFTVVSDIQLTAVAPPGAAGTVLVTVTTAGGTSGGVPYGYLAAPALTAVSPVQGPTAGGNTVTLTGGGLTSTASVAFGTAFAAFTVVSDSTVTAIAPAGAAGTVGVTATTPAGTTPAVSYTRVPPPVI